MYSVNRYSENAVIKIMKVISIDVGIKNMAYCVFEVSGGRVVVLDWRVVSLMNPEVSVPRLCNATCISKSTKKVTEKVCGRAAKYTKAHHSFCDKHAKSQTDYVFPRNIKKMKLPEIKAYAHELGIENIPMKKGDIIEVVDAFQTRRGLESILKPRGVRANETDLIQIGKNMKSVLNEVLKEHRDITHVLIENQISPLANRMKTVQGMLSQYFIMTYESIEIEFISSANKLKMFKAATARAEDQGQRKGDTQSQIYKR
ncbi:MAG: hypothetical protein EBQ66_00505, partial [Flavobacteriia bacterium]|nr:hypothetical protein [Flavobacteriia bacterium]